MRNPLLSLLAATALVGCVGGVDLPDDPNDPNNPSNPNNPNNPNQPDPNNPLFAESKNLYNTTVHPIMAAKCINCHAATGANGNSSPFVTTNVADSYVSTRSVVTVMGDGTPTGAPILTKVNVSGGHQGTSYTAAEVSAITAWLNKELEARASNPGSNPDPGQPQGESPAAATTRVTKEWSGCLTLANFTAANMRAWANVRADNSACQTCHEGGAYGMIASQQDTPFFQLMSTNKYYMAQFFSVDLSGGAAAAKIVINTKSFATVGQAIAPHQTHPRFNPTNNAGMTALQKLYDTTMAAKTAGTCGPPTLAN